MTTILGAAVSGMLSNQFILDTVSNNVSNGDTFAFKRERPVAEGSLEPAATPENSRLGVSYTVSDLVFDPGTPVATGDDLNFMIMDDAFYRVTTASGDVAFTRTGLLGAQADGGIRLFGMDLDPAITMPPGAHTPSISADGRVTARTVDGAVLELGQVNLFRFSNAKGLRDIGGGLYTETANSGAIFEGIPGDGSFDKLLPGMVEGSNVEIAAEMSSMIIAQRSYQACARTFTIGDEMLKLATNITR